jgi:hypothetical protein
MTGAAQTVCCSSCAAKAPAIYDLYWDDINISRIRDLGEAMTPDIELF